MFTANRNYRIFSSVAFYLFKLIDLLFIIAFGFFAYIVTHDAGTENSLLKTLVIIALLVFCIVARQFNLYRPWRDLKLRSELWLIVILNSYVITATFFIGLIIGLKVTAVNINWLAYWVVLTIGAQIFLRIFTRSLLRSLRSHGFNQRNILLVGTHDTARDVMKVIKNRPEFGLQLLGYVDDRVKQRSTDPIKLDHLGRAADIEAISTAHNIDQVWITYPMQGEDRAKEVIERMKYSTVSIRYVFDFSVIKDNEKSLTDFGGIPLLDIDVSPMDGVVGRTLKNIEDKIIAAIILVILSPLLLILAIGVKLSSPGPVFYRQTRISWNNKPFTMLKFRSMPVDAEKDTGAMWAKQGELRATKFGAFLRKTSLDELPQFINVLLGDMSIIGPRPERPELIEQFKTEIPDYMKKHMVKGGITGWAQVNGFRGDTDLNARIQHDLYYVKNWSLLFDLTIALQTFYKGFINKNAY